MMLAELTAVLNRIPDSIAMNPKSPAWDQLEARWLAVVEHAKGVVAAFHSGKAGVRYVRKAAEEVIKVAEAATPRDVVETVLAIFVMQELDPRRFRSDLGFRFQLVRRLRALADVNAGQRWDHKSDKVRRVYRQVTPRAVATIGQWLADALGGAGVQLGGLEVRDTETARRSLRCAIYTRVSTDQGLEQDFNSLDAQREASEAYVKSQAHEGWRLIRDRYDDGGYSGGSMERPALQKLRYIA
jgi:hypothetical protein